MAQRRSICDVRVGDSFAWARLAEGGTSVWEAVYWPEIELAVVNEAAALKATVGDSEKRATFMGRLPLGTATDGRVVIRHGSFTFRGTFYAVALYEVMHRPPAGKPFLRHFRADGVEVRLPEELPAFADTPKGK